MFLGVILQDETSVPTVNIYLYIKPAKLKINKNTN